MRKTLFTDSYVLLVLLFFKVGFLIEIFFVIPLMWTRTIFLTTKSRWDQSE